MNYDEISNTVEHLKKTCKCPQCNGGYDNKNISVIATTTIEGLLELRCVKCKTSTLVTVIVTPNIEVKEQNHRTHRGISDNDLLDIKNFLSNFDGDFKKVFDKPSNPR